jgi:hypothetical protein
VPIVRVETAEEMHRAVVSAVGDADVVVMAAAVADFRPKVVSDGKLKKESGTPELHLEPTPDILDELEIPDGDTLYGLYQGTPLTERQWSQEPRVPDRVSIYQRPIEEDAESEDDIVWMIGETVIHEFGHYFGLSEDEIEAIEERYWRGEEGPDS